MKKKGTLTDHCTLLRLTLLLSFALLLFFTTTTQAQKHPIPFLHQACLDGNHEQVQGLINAFVARGGKEKMIDAINKKDHIVGVPPLYAAATNGHLRVVKVLLQAGADVNLRTADGSTPLHAAAFGGHMEVVKYLVEHGANTYAVNDNMITPIAAAEYNEYNEIVDYLQKHQRKSKPSPDEL